MDAIDRISQWLENRELEMEVDEEVRFHLESLHERYLREGLSKEEADVATRRRFGDAELIKRECIEIGKRSRPMKRILKVVFLAFFLAGVLIRVFRTDLQITHMGDVLMMVAASGGLFLYVRGLAPSTFFSKEEPRSPLRLVERSQMSIPAYDEQKRTPTERVISSD